MKLNVTFTAEVDSATMGGDDRWPALAEAKIAMFLDDVLNMHKGMDDCTGYVLKFGEVTADMVEAYQ